MATLLTCYYRPKPGGLTARYTRAMQALLRAGHNIHYVSLAPFPIDHPNCTFHRFPWPAPHSDSLIFWSIFIITAPFYLLYIALRHGVDRVFCFDTLYALVLLPIQMLSRRPTTCFMRGDAVEALRAQNRPHWMVRLYLLMERLALHGGRIVGSGAHLTAAIIERHPKLHLVAIYNLPNDMPPVERPHSPKAQHTTLRLAAVGLLTPQKNHAFALSLASALDGLSFQLNIFGSGPLAAKLDRQVRRDGLQHHVRLQGWVDQGEIWTSVDLLLMPSLNEGAPNAVLEALANGVPVLASDIPGHRAILPAQHCLPLGKPDVWCRHLKSIIEKPETSLADMHQTQLLFANKLRFDWDGRIVDLIVPADG